MRRTARLLASAKPARFLEAGAPTGLTGVLTHAAPRPALLELYKTTLEKLSALPPSSLYRQATENLTKHRMSIVESVQPAGYDAWLAGSKTTATPETKPASDTKEDEAILFKFSDAQAFHTLDATLDAAGEPEPPLTADQIVEIENKIGAGLIEEVIQVAEGELKLIDLMAESKVWEDLEEKPAEGQWKYFERP